VTADHGQGRGAAADAPVEVGLPIDPDAARPPHRRRRRMGRADVVAVIAAGGALGGLGRWALSEVLPTAGGGFPWSTFVENVTGSLLLGALMVFLLDVWPPGRYARPFLGVGVLGGFTTFSTYTAESRALLVEGRVPVAMTYLSSTVAVCLLAAWTGVSLARSAAGVGRPHTRRHR
jgi:fluoride exporter